MKLNMVVVGVGVFLTLSAIIAMDEQIISIKASQKEAEALSITPGVPVSYQLFRNKLLDNFFTEHVVQGKKSGEFPELGTKLQSYSIAKQASIIHYLLSFIHWDMPKSVGDARKDQLCFGNYAPINKICNEYRTAGYAEGQARAQQNFKIHQKVYTTFDKVIKPLLYFVTGYAACCAWIAREEIKDFLWKQLNATGY